MPGVVFGWAVNLIQVFIAWPDASGSIGCSVTSDIAEEDRGIPDCEVSMCGASISKHESTYEVSGTGHS